MHAGVSTEAHQRDKLERSGGVPLCRYICRPAVSEKRLALTSNGNIRYQLKTPYRDGTTHVIFEPLDFIVKRVFNIDIETCERCAGQVKIIACIEDPAVIERILA